MTRQPALPRRFSIARALRYENVALAVVLVVITAVFGVLTSGATSSFNGVRNIMVQSSTTGIAAVGQLFVVLTGGIDLSFYGSGVFASMIGAGLMTDRFDQNSVGHVVSANVAVPIMLLVGAGIGAINGLLVTRARIPPLIATLGMWQIGYGLAQLVAGGKTITSLSEGLRGFGQASVGAVPVPVITFLALVGISYYVLRYTSFGRAIFAFGGNPTSAWLSGIDVRRTQFLVFVISGFLAAAAGVSLEARMMSASLENLRGIEIDTVAAVTVGGASLAGGKGSAIGLLIGTVIVALVRSGLYTLGAGPDVLNLAKGAIIIGAVAVDQFLAR